MDAEAGPSATFRRCSAEQKQHAVPMVLALREELVLKTVSSDVTHFSRARRAVFAVADMAMMAIAQHHGRPSTPTAEPPPTNPGTHHDLVQYPAELRGRLRHTSRRATQLSVTKVSDIDAHKCLHLGAYVCMLLSCSPIVAPRTGPAVIRLSLTETRLALLTLLTPMNPRRRGTRSRTGLS